MFKVPSAIPQDLLLIHDLVSAPVPGRSDEKNLSRVEKTEESPESIDSSSESSDDDSSSEDSEEVNVVENLLTKVDGTEEDGDVKVRSPSPSSSESSSKESDTSSESESDEEADSKTKARQVLDDFDEDDVGGARAPSGTALRTKNEIPDPSVVTPDITEIDVQEPLEKVGEIMSIIDNTVVVKGIASQNENKASERALDFESLLVFEDRKVLGYVYETFGPTYQPLYQVKFPSAASIDRNMVTISREVFHVPHCSHFVFSSQLSKMKGSDASNVHDEEVNEDEIEFSDDEAEAAFRQRRKRKREGYRESSVASSRFSTPGPSQMRDQELNEISFYGASPYDEYGPYDMGVAPGPSRPPPLPYDDPYQDELSASSQNASIDSRESGPNSPRDPRSLPYDDSRGRGYGLARGRGRGRGRGRDNRGRGGPAGGSGHRRDRRPSISRGGNSSSNGSRSLSPTSMAIARATGQYGETSALAPHQAPLSSSSPPLSPHNHWQQQQDVGYGQFNNQTQTQQSYDVQQMQYGQQQPHINPRFASLFGINMAYMQGQQYRPYTSPNSPLANNYTPYSPNASWTNNTWPQNASGGNLQSNSANEYPVQRKTENDEYRP